MGTRQYPIGGYAPGHYRCKCVTCKETFTGDKRAVQCEPCAVETTKPDWEQLRGADLDKPFTGWDKAKEKTLEEAAKKSFREIWTSLTVEQSEYLKGYIDRQIDGAKKWQAERMYSRKTLHS
jgi:hypothetical protein